MSSESVRPRQRHGTSAVQREPVRNRRSDITLYAQEIPSAFEPPTGVVFENIRRLPIDNLGRSGRFNGVPLTIVINLLDLLRRSPPLAVEMIAECYQQAYGNEVASPSGLEAILQSLEHGGLLVRSQLGQYVVMTVAKLSEASPWKSLNYSIPSWRQDPPRFIEGAVLYDEQTSTFRLTPPPRPQVDLRSLREQLTVRIIQPNADYLIVRNGEQHVVRTVHSYLLQNATGSITLRWSIRFEDNTVRTCFPGELVPCELAGVRPFAIWPMVWPSGRKPWQGENVRLKVLDEIMPDSLVCCYADEELITKYRLELPTSDPFTITIISWAGRSLVEKWLANVLGGRNVTTVKLVSLPRPASLRRLLRAHNILSDEFMYLFSIVDVLFRHGIHIQICRDMFLM